MHDPDARVLKTRVATLLPSTVGLVEVGRVEASGLVASYFDFLDGPPTPRRDVARILRVLADNLESTADELEQLEHS